MSEMTLEQALMNIERTMPSIAFSDSWKTIKAHLTRAPVQVTDEDVDVAVDAFQNSTSYGLYRVAMRAALESLSARLAQPVVADAGHKWNVDGEKCLKCGDKDWMAAPSCAANENPGTRQSFAEDDFYVGHSLPELHPDPLTNAEIFIDALTAHLDTARKALALAAAMQVVTPELSEVKSNASWAMHETDPRRIMPRSAKWEGHQTNGVPVETIVGYVSHDELDRIIIGEIETAKLYAARKPKSESVPLFLHPHEQPHPQAAQGGEARGEALGEYLANVDAHGGVRWINGKPPHGTKLYTHPAERASVPDDTAILDWLCEQHIEVRTPARYGSRANFVTSPEDDDGFEQPNELRKLARESMLCAAPTSDTCANCDALMPEGCKGTFKDEKECRLHDAAPTLAGKEKG